MVRCKKIGAAVLAALLGLALIAAFPAGAAAEEEVPQFPTYTQDFSSEEAVNADFSAGYVEALNRMTRSESVGQVDGHWFLEDGVLVRRNDIDGEEGGTWRAALLTYTRQVYANFELEVDYRQGTETNWWAAVIFRQSESKNMLDDGAGVFVQAEGTMTMWGSTGVGGPHEALPVIEDYDREAWHNMKLTVLGNTATMQIDGDAVGEWTLQQMFYREGYITLASINNDSAFDNLKITELPEPEEEAAPVYPPVAEADTDDSLGNLAGVQDEQAAVERPIAFDDSYGGQGCSSSLAFGGAALVGAALVGLAAVWLKKKE